jgi:hypothetical protein
MVGGVRLTSCVHRNDGAAPLVPLYTFMVWTGVALPLCFWVISITKLFCA